MRFQTRAEAALYLWDYFYVSNAPDPRDEKPWRKIEKATQRIRELESSVRLTVPAETRLRSARLLRRAIRVITDQLPRLHTEVAPWVHELLAVLELDATTIIAGLEQPAPPVIH